MSYIFSTESGGIISQSHDKSDSDSLSQETGLSDADGSSGWPNNSCNQNSNISGQARAHMKRKSASETSRELSQENHSYASCNYLFVYIFFNLLI